VTTHTLQALADGFWNLRGIHRVGGLLDIGTQMSVARRPDGRLVLVDAIDLGDAQHDALLALTDDGALVDAVVHVHPFHTLHVAALQRAFPAATLYGTARHRERLPQLPWAGTPVETWGDGHPLADVFDLSVPDGVDFVCADDSVHVGSVLARHRPSGVVHVDDTFNVISAPGPLRGVLPQSALKMHPMLAKALTPEAGAADAYARWARELAVRWADAPAVCAAHSAVRAMAPGQFAKEVEAALGNVEKALAKHRARFG
jgi:hypothetical protein